MVVVTLSLFATAIIKDQSLRAKSDGTNVVVQWQTSLEQNVRSFVIERSTGGEGSFSQIGTIAPQGANSYYEFIDHSAFKNQIPANDNTNSFFEYRVKIVDTNGTVAYSNTVTVTHNVSSVKRTWGSLKAMFR
jgi:hypothetical protein